MWKLNSKLGHIFLDSVLNIMYFSFWIHNTYCKYAILRCVIFYVYSHTFWRCKTSTLLVPFPMLSSVADLHLLLSGSGIRILGGKHYRRKITQQIVNQIFQNDNKKSLKIPVLYSPYEPVHFLGFFTPWIRIRIMSIRIREAFFNADPCGCGSGSATLILIF